MWGDPDHAAAAAVLQKFLLSDQQQSGLASFGFRRTDETTPLVSPIDRAHGVDPRANLVLIEVPDPRVIDAVVELWEGFTNP